MNDRYEVRPSRVSDIWHVAGNMRSEDRDEIWAFAHATPLEALWTAVVVSRDTTFTGLVDGEPVCMFGVKEPSTLGGPATPWMLGTDKLKLHQMAFLRRSVEIVKVFSEMYPHMENHVDARNTDTIAWLQWLGFKVYYPRAFGLERLPFHRFEMRAE